MTAQSIQQSESQRRRSRITFNSTQLIGLEKEFTRNRYVLPNERLEIAKMLNLTEDNIRIWFQNKRRKLKTESSLYKCLTNPITQNLHCE